jgi:asparagine synthase (glutamine-hydrolysing)
MCGITGIFNIESAAPPRPGELESMVDTIYHRGPDARGVHSFPGGGLGSTRLAIIDLRPESNMPFCSNDGRYSIAYNGEVFNYVELREELEGLGHRFRTQSDTEVVIEAYRRWGAHAVERFNGMWAFAIYDSERDELFCSRDRFGIKPLFYAHHDGRLLVASEIKALLAIAPELAAPDHEQFTRFVAATTMPETERTFFATIKQVLPAHNLIADRQGFRTVRYWDYPGRAIEIGSAEAAEQVRALLDDAIRLRLRSDVPVGMLLSAGVDSSAIACLVRQFEHGPFRAFTASYPGDPFDEAPAAAALARQLDIQHQLIPEEGIDVLETARAAIWHLESPTSYSEIVPRWHIYQQMSGEITVAFEGQGADELFGGYTTENAPAAVSDALGRGNLFDVAATLRRQVAEVGWRTAASRGAANILSPDLVRQVQRARGRDFASSPSTPPAPNTRAHHGEHDRLTSQLYRQHTGQLRAQLRWGDAISMAHSIETRYPFLDYRLVELGFQLRGDLKMRRGVGKAVLRDAVRPDVPESVLRPQRKRGFGTPVARWFRDDPQHNLYPLLHDSIARSRDLIDIGRVDTAARSLLEGQADTSWLLFKWLTVELWFRLFIDAAPVARATAR